MNETVAKKTPLSEIHALSRESTLTNPYAPIVVTLLFFSIKFALSACSGSATLPSALWAQILVKCFSFLTEIFFGLFVAGRIRYFTLLCENRDATIGNLFHAFKKGPDRVLTASAIYQGIPFLCSLPAYVYSVFHPVIVDMSGSMPRISKENLIGAGIISLMLLCGAILSFLILIPFVPLYYIITDFDKIPLSKAIRMSFWLMKGNKLRYIGLCLSMIPFFILGYLSLGLAFIWISPYIQCNYAHFYLDLMKQKQGGN